MPFETFFVPFCHGSKMAKSEKTKKGRNDEQLCISSGMSTYRFIYPKRCKLFFHVYFLTRCVKTVKCGNTKTKNSKKNCVENVFFCWLTFFSSELLFGGPKHCCWQNSRIWASFWIECVNGNNVHAARM